MGRQLELEAAALWTVRCSALMPDHLHLLVTLHTDTSLSNAVREFKGPLTPALRLADVSWQPGFYDHRVRMHDDLFAVFLYIFLNPYRAGLCGTAEVWPGYYCCPNDWSWFGAMTKESRPEPDWLR